MRWLLLIVGTLVAYEAVVKALEFNRRYGNKPDDARLHRARVLNQQGTLPHEIDY